MLPRRRNRQETAKVGRSILLPYKFDSKSRRENRNLYERVLDSFKSKKSSKGRLEYSGTKAGCQSPVSSKIRAALILPLLVVSQEHLVRNLSS